MPAFPTQHISESERLMALCVDVSDPVSERVYDEVVQLAARICEVPIALIVLVDDTKQYIRAKVGLDVDETPRELIFTHKYKITTLRLLIYSSS